MVGIGDVDGKRKRDYGGEGERGSNYDNIKGKRE